MDLFSINLELSGAGFIWRRHIQSCSGVKNWFSGSIRASRGSSLGLLDLAIARPTDTLKGDFLKFGIGRKNLHFLELV